MFRSLRTTGYRRAPHRSRLYTLETLERREMLSSVPPTVVNVEVGSTAWSPAFIQYLQDTGLGTNGYAIPKGNNGQLASLTWNNIDQIIITFSEDVYVDKADLSLSGVTVTAYGFSRFHYDPQTLVATWTLAAPLDRDRLRLDLDAGGLDPVRDLDGNRLDGEWHDAVSVVSGDGTAGGDFEFRFNVLPTDVNNTGNITNYDYIYIRQLDGKTTNDAGYNPIRDIDGSGVINSADWQEAQSRINQALPSGLPAGTYNDAPTTSGFDRVQIDAAAVDIAISLLTGFADTEDGSSGLTYSILSNSNPSLFNTASIDGSGHSLVLNAASSATGRASIVVRATDSGGLHVDTTVTVDVNRENQPPFISEFFVLNAGWGTYVVSGYVSDPDDDVSSFIVNFSGVFVTRAGVDENGYFEFAIILEDDEWGREWAVTYDPHGAKSNEPSTVVGLT